MILFLCYRRICWGEMLNSFRYCLVFSQKLWCGSTIVQSTSCWWWLILVVQGSWVTVVIVHLLRRRLQFDSIVHYCVIATLATGIWMRRWLKWSSLESCFAIRVNVIAFRQRVLQGKLSIRFHFQFHSTQTQRIRVAFTYIAMTIIVRDHSLSSAPNPLSKIFSATHI